MTREMETAQYYLLSYYGDTAAWMHEIEIVWAIAKQGPSPWTTPGQAKH